MQYYAAFNFGISLGRESWSENVAKCMRRCAKHDECKFFQIRGWITELFWVDNILIIYIIKTSFNFFLRLIFMKSLININLLKDLDSNDYDGSPDFSCWFGEDWVEDLSVYSDLDTFSFQHEYNAFRFDDYNQNAVFFVISLFRKR